MIRPSTDHHHGVEVVPNEFLMSNPPKFKALCERVAYILLLGFLHQRKRFRSLLVHFPRTLPIPTPPPEPATAPLIILLIIPVKRATLHLGPRGPKRPAKSILDILFQMARQFDVSDVRWVVLGPDVVVLQDPCCVEVVDEVCVCVGFEVRDDGLDLGDEGAALGEGVAGCACFGGKGGERVLVCVWKVGLGVV